jgi:K+-transporting ATPase ATPase A chain
MLDSFMPLSGLVCLLFLQLGDPVIGGLGSGMYCMLMFVLLTVFIGGLMVGRTPEYLGKKLGAFEIKMVSLVMLVPTILILLGTALAVSMEGSAPGTGSHGLSQVMYAFSSAANNNGSAFAGISSNTPFYNLALGVVMFLGRYWLIIPVLAVAGSLVEKNTVPVSAGTLPTHTLLFTLLLVGVILMVGVLNFVPPLVMGPFVEHLLLTAGGL